MYRLFVYDLGSTHGTFVDGLRVAGEREKGMVSLRHGSELVVGSTVFGIHVHEEWPCKGCGVSEGNRVETFATIHSHASKVGEGEESAALRVPAPVAHKMELKNLKRSLLGGNSGGGNLQAEWNDRSAMRRKLHEGHLEPFHGNHDRYAEVDNSSVQSSANSSGLSLQQQQIRVRQHLHNQRREELSTPVESAHGNSRVGGIGESMLTKMGWIEGTGLGKREDSILDPIE
ncbi:hypothetical protein HDU98_000292, partial [Podochytrium sp. JEL0797]